MKKLAIFLVTVFMTATTAGAEPDACLAKLKAKGGPLADFGRGSISKSPRTSTDLANRSGEIAKLREELKRGKILYPDFAKKELAFHKQTSITPDDSALLKLGIAFDEMQTQKGPNGSDIRIYLNGGKTVAYSLRNYVGHESSGRVVQRASVLYAVDGSCNPKDVVRSDHFESGFENRGFPYLHVSAKVCAASGAMRLALQKFGPNGVSALAREMCVAQGGLRSNAGSGKFTWTYCECTKSSVGFNPFEETCNEKRVVTPRFLELEEIAKRTGAIVRTPPTSLESFAEWNRLCALHFPPPTPGKAGASVPGKQPDASQTPGG